MGRFTNVFCALYSAAFATAMLGAMGWELWGGTLLTIPATRHVEPWNPACLALWFVCVLRLAWVALDKDPALTRGEAS